MKGLLIIKPRLSEKAYAQSRDGVYTFEVPKDASKLSIAHVVEDQYKVTVTEVNTTITKGKRKRSYRKSGRSIVGTRSDVKKAYVTLKKGDTLPIFAEEEKQEKATQKAAEKKAKKEGAK